MRLDFEVYIYKDLNSRINTIYPNPILTGFGLPDPIYVLEKHGVTHPGGP